MAYNYEVTDTSPFGTAWRNRSHTDRKIENEMQRAQIGNIETFLSSVDWGSLGKEYDLSDYLKTGDISGLQDWKGTATGQLSTLEGGLGTAQSDIKFLQEQLANWDTTTSVGDVKGLDDILGGLKDKYASTGDVSDLQTSLTGTQKGLDMLTGSGAGSITDQITKATDALGINDYMKTSDFNTRMTDNLDALGDTLRGEWGSAIETLDLDTIKKDLDTLKGDTTLSDLGTKFLGVSKDVDWIKELDFGGQLDTLKGTGEGSISDMISTGTSGIKDDLSGLTTDVSGLESGLQTLTGTGEGSIAQQIKSGGDVLKETIEEGRGKDLATLEKTIGKDRAADLLTTKQAIEQDRISDIQAIAANLRQERGDDIFDLTQTFQDKHDTLKDTLGSDITDLFGTTAGLTAGLDTLTSGLGTTAQQLDALQTSFGDYKTDSATNLANVEKAFGKQVGDLGTDFTSKLSGLESSVASDILGLSQKTGDDISGLRSDLSGDITDVGTAAQKGIAGAREAAATGLASLSTKTAEDIAGAREAAATGIAGAKAESAAGLKELSTTVAEDRRKALSNLDTTWSGKLQAQDQRFQDQLQRDSDAFNKRLSDISSSMNYKMLGDSAQGVKIRRSKAYNQGRTRSGTGQLGRSMKISSLNI